MLSWSIAWFGSARGRVPSWSIAWFGAARGRELPWGIAWFGLSPCVQYTHNVMGHCLLWLSQKTRTVQGHSLIWPSSVLSVRPRLSWGFAYFGSAPRGSSSIADRLRGATARGVELSVVCRALCLRYAPRSLQPTLTLLAVLVCSPQ
jgi:hypothetical protein